MFMQEKMIELGYGHKVPRTRVILLLDPKKKNIELKRVLQDAEAREGIIDLTSGAKCRCIVVVEDPVACKYVFSLKSPDNISRQMSDC